MYIIYLLGSIDPSTGILIFDSIGLDRSFY